MPRCDARTQRGTRCRNNCTNMLDKCFIHSDECPICMSRLATGDDCSTLKCGHKFHAGCIYNWFDRDHRCPVCRGSVRKPTVHVYFDSANSTGTSSSDVQGLIEKLYNRGDLNVTSVIVDSVDGTIRIRDYHTLRVIHTEHPCGNMDS